MRHLFVVGGAADGLEFEEGGAGLLDVAEEALFVEAEFGEVGGGVGRQGEDVGFDAGDALEAPVLGDEGFGEGGFLRAGGGEVGEHALAEFEEIFGGFLVDQGVEAGGEAVGGGVQAGDGLAFGGARAGGMLGVGAVDFGAGASRRLGKMGRHEWGPFVSQVCEAGAGPASI